MRILNLYNLYKVLPRRSFCTKIHKKFKILGIETSCDDTGVALVNNEGKILGESLFSQQSLHLKYGGITPPRAQELHRENIEKAVNECLDKADTDISKIDAIGVTNRPGLPMSLMIGLRYGKHLSRKFLKPLIPIHHMEAHALSVRLERKVSFPFLCLLISGGHCQLVIVKNSADFYLLGETLDDAPGEAFDKIARKLKLRNLKEFEWLNGGAAIELAAKKAENENRYEFPLPLARYRDCQFSFAGLKNNAIKNMKQAEIDDNVRPDEVIPYYADFCAGFLKAVTRHLSYRTQRAIEYCERKKIFEKSPKNLVISGGVACNDYIFDVISEMAKHYKYETYRPSKKLCSDNGVMIAWNTIEKINANTKYLLEKKENLDEIDIYGKCSLGTNIIEDVIKEDISCKWIKVTAKEKIDKKA